MVAPFKEDLGPCGGSVGLGRLKMLAIDPNPSHSVASLFLAGRRASIKRALAFVRVARVIEPGGQAILTARAAVDLDRDDVLPRA